MKNLKIKIAVLTFLSILSFAFNKGISQTLQDAVAVPVFEGTIVNNSIKNIFWDLSEINNVNNRLDLVAGVRQTGYQAPNVYNYTNGNWYKNQDNSNFNSEVTDNRFIYQTGDEGFNGITGMIFSKLNSNSSQKKEVVVTRDDKKIYVFKNDPSTGTIELNDFQIFFCDGKVAAVGKFTNDTLEDVAVISGSTLKIYKNMGNSTLDSVPVFTLYNVNAEKVIITQISNYINPYSIINGTTGDRDEIIIKSGSGIKIYKNNNNNGISDSTLISINGGIFTDFKISDIDNDGFNDLIVAGFNDGIKIFKNTTGIISSSTIYSNSNYAYPSTTDVADFNKDGYNDLVVANYSNIFLFLNTRGTFSQTVSYTKSYNTEFFGRKLKAVDLHNKGGISVLYSGTTAIFEEEFDPQSYDDEENIIRFNATDSDAVPAPPLLFKDLVLIGQHYRPRLHIYNRGDRDFQKYIIYKKSPNFNNNNWFLYDSSNTSGDYVDDAEAFNEGGLSDPPPPDNLFYYVKAQDNSYQASISSDTIGYPTTVCPGCAWEAGDNFTVSNIPSNEIPKEYSVKNYPNPFNPVTQIYFNIPVEGNVRITVFNIAGQKVSELINEFKSPGSYKIEFNGKNLASGIYYYRIEAGNFSQVGKMILLK